MSYKNNAILKKRILLGVLLGALAGVFCFSGFSSNQDMPAELMKWQTWSLSNPMMWSTIIGRTILGLVVALAGFMTVHPFFGFKFPSFLRGAAFGLWTSLSMAIGALMGSDPAMAKSGFWIVIVMGVIIGSLIDVIITKFSGEGRDLVDC